MMTPLEEQLLAAVREALFDEWDPIQVNHCPSGTDEYDSYAPRLTEMLLEGRSEQDIFDELWKIETQTIGLRGNREATKYFARQLTQIAVEVRERMSDR